MDQNDLDQPTQIDTTIPISSVQETYSVMPKNQSKVKRLLPIFIGVIAILAVIMGWYFFNSVNQKNDSKISENIIIPNNKVVTDAASQCSYDDLTVSDGTTDGYKKISMDCIGSIEVPKAVVENNSKCDSLKNMEVAYGDGFACYGLTFSIATAKGYDEAVADVNKAIADGFRDSLKSIEIDGRTAIYSRTDLSSTSYIHNYDVKVGAYGWVPITITTHPEGPSTISDLDKIIKTIKITVKE